MNLSADQFLDILDSLRSDSTSRRITEKRSGPRVGTRLRATVILSPGQANSTTISTWIRDLSPNGICIVHDQPVPAGTQFIVRFPAQDRAPLSVLYSTAHCRQLSGSTFCIGARLLHILPDLRPDHWRKLAQELNRQPAASPA